MAFLACQMIPGMIQPMAYAENAPVDARQHLRMMSQAFADVYESVAPSVVIIEVRGDGRNARSRHVWPGLEFFMPPSDEESTVPEIPPTEGSGFIIREDGYILTNYHVVEDARERGITVRLHDGKKLEGKVAGYDEKTDLAVLKVDARGLPAVEFGDSDAVRVGEFAFAIGAPFELPYTFTVGVISAKGRKELVNSTPYTAYLQTDASINPGNSGGPLCNIDGKVIGVNTMIYGINRGMGFAIPSNMVRDISEKLIAEGRVRRPWLGIGIENFADNSALRKVYPKLKEGVVVRGVMSQTPAEKSGLKPDDIIQSVDGVPVRTAEDLQKQILAKEIGTTVELEVVRQDGTHKLRIPTAEMPRREAEFAANAVPVPVPSPPAVFQEWEIQGMRLQDITRSLARMLMLRRTNGVVVMAVDGSSPAAEAGIRPGDIIVEANGARIQRSTDLLNQIDALGGASQLSLKLDRGGESVEASITIKP